MANNQIEIVRNEPDCIIVRHASKNFGDYFTVFTTYTTPQMYTFMNLEDALGHVEFKRAEAKKGGAQ